MTDAMGQYMTGLLADSGVSADAMRVENIGVTVDLSEYNSAQPMTPPAV